MDLVNILKSIAPGLATAVAGPLGGIAVKAIADKLGVENEVNAVAQAIAGDPEAARKLAEIDLEQFKAEAADRHSAREMQIAALQQEDRVAKNFIYWYAWYWGVGSTLYFFCVTFIEMPQGGRDFANIILGFLLGTAVATIISFFYGSSKSSKDKTEALVKEIK